MKEMLSFLSTAVSLYLKLSDIIICVQKCLWNELISIITSWLFSELNFDKLVDDLIW